MEMNKNKMRGEQHRGREPMLLGIRLSAESAQTMSSSIGEFWPTKWLLGGYCVHRERCWTKSIRDLLLEKQ